MSEQLNLNVQNVKCGGCAEAIQKGLTTLPGVESVKVDIATGNVTIQGQLLSQQQLSEKLAELGYPVI